MMRVTSIAAGVGLVLLGGSVPLLIAAAQPGPTFDGSDYAAVSEDFTQSQQSGDELPNFLTNGDQALSGVLDESSRQLGSLDGVKYWEATDEQGNVCIVSLFPGSDQFASMSCAPRAVVLKQGLTLQAAANDADAVQATLLPEGYAATPPGQTVVGDQLLVTDADESHAAFKATPESGTTGSSTITIPATAEIDSEK